MRSLARGSPSASRVVYEDDSEDEWSPVPLPVVGIDETLDSPLRRGSSSIGGPHPDLESGYGILPFLGPPPERRRHQQGGMNAAGNP